LESTPKRIEPSGNTVGEEEAWSAINNVSAGLMHGATPQIGKFRSDDAHFGVRLEFTATTYACAESR
jgi:hypothetical protein